MTRLPIGGLVIFFAIFVVALAYFWRSDNMVPMVLMAGWFGAHNVLIFSASSSKNRVALVVTLVTALVIPMLFALLVGNQTLANAAGYGVAFVIYSLVVFALAWAARRLHGDGP